MNRNESTLHNQVRQLNDYLEGDEKSRWIADVLRVLDEDGNCTPGSPILIRTEMRDITVSWPDGRHLQISTEPVECCGESSELTWSQHALLRELIGAKIENIEVEASSSGDAFHMGVDESRAVSISPRESTITAA